MIKICVKKLLIFFIAVVFSVLHFSCRKEKMENGIEISIVKPSENSLFFSPGYLTAHVRVVSDMQLKFLKFNITDENFVTVFGDVTFLPDSTVFEKDIDFEIVAKDVDETSPYYFHVFAQSKNFEKNKYIPIFLKNRNKALKGIVLFEEYDDGKTGMLFHDADCDSLLMILDGEYLSSGFSTENNLLFVQQSLNPLMSAYETSKFLMQWHYSSQSVEKPVTMTCDFSTNLLFTASTDGSISGFDMVSGVEKLHTRFMKDTVPRHVGVTRDFIFADCRTKLNGQTLWLVFYKNTGIKLSTQPVTADIVEVFNNYDGNTVDLVENKDGKSVLVKYDASQNKVLSETVIVPEPLTAAVKLKDNDYVLATSTALYHYSGGFVEVLDCVSSDDIADLAFDDSENRLFVLKNRGFEVVKLPQCEVVESVEYDKKTTGIQLIYKYQY